MLQFSRLSEAFRLEGGLRKIQMLKCDPTHEPIRIGETFHHFHMCVVLANNKLNWFPRRPHCRCKLSPLALKLRSFESSISDNERRREVREVTLWAEVVFHRVIKPYVCTPRRKPDRLKIVNTTDANSTFNRVGRSVKVLRPICCKHDPCNVRSCGEAAEIDTIRISTELGRILMYPRNGAAHLVRHRP
jgi:hypothetical protein